MVPESMLRPSVERRMPGDWPRAANDGTLMEEPATEAGADTSKSAASPMVEDMAARTMLSMSSSFGAPPP